MNISCFNKVKCLLILLFFSSVLSSQQDIQFYNLGVDQGLSQNSVSSIVQDKHGFIWIGTASGLNLYDGYSFKAFHHNPKDSLTISESAITSLFVTQNGDLLIGTRFGGFNRLSSSTRKVRRYLYNAKKSNTISSNSVNCVLETKKGILLVGTDNGLDVGNSDQFVRIKHNTSSTNNEEANKVTAIFEDTKGKVWVGGKPNTISLVDLTNKNYIDYSDPFLTSRKYIIKSVKEFAPGILMLATSSGIRFFDTYTKRFINCLIEYSNTDTINKMEITAFTKDKMGNVWCGININQSENLLAKINPTDKSINYLKASYNKKDAFQPEKIISLFTDLSGLIWMGFDGKGISYFNPAPADFFHLKKGPKSMGLLTNEYVYAIEESKDGSVWIGTNDFELHHYFPKTREMKYYSKGIINRNWCSDIEPSKSGKLWVSFRKNEDEGGVILFDEEKNTYQTIDEISGIPNAIGTYLVRVLKEENDILWVGTQDAGLISYHQKTKKIKKYKHDKNVKNSIASNEIADLLRDSKGRLWIATRGGLSLMNKDNETFINYTVNSSSPIILSSNNALVVMEDKRGRICVGTGHGLNVLNEKENNVETISIDDGLPDNYVYGVLEDSQGKYWISTNNGLSCVDPLNKTIKNYTTSNGLQSGEFNTHAFHKGRSGKFYFGGINGMNIFYPDSIKIKSFKPSIAITSFAVFGKEFALDSSIHSKKQIILSYKENFFSFDFAALDFFHPEKNMVACKLSGFDNEWIILKDHHSISYSNLDPGEYKLRVKGTNSDGVWNNTETVLSIIITPPFYKTTWFYLVCGLIFVLLLRFIYRYRIRKLLSNRRELERQVQERTEQLNTQKNELSKAYNSVKLLSEIGKNITSTLELNEIGSIIFSQLNTILDTKVFAVGIMNQSKGTIDFISIMIEGVPKETLSIASDQERSYSGWCIGNAKEIMINDFSTDSTGLPIGADNCVVGNKAQSVIYVPIFNSRAEAYGVFTIQSFNKNAYTEYHLSLLKNLSVYINIAIENANAYKTILEARIELEKLSLVASKTDNGVVICNERGDIEWINEGFTRMYGHTFESFINTYDRNIVKASNSSKITKTLKECLETKKSVSYESRATTKEGKILWVQTTLTPILDQYNNIQKLVAIDADITVLKQAEEKILRQKNEIETKNKDITDSINYAQRIQKATLATKVQFEESFSDHFVFFKPKDIVSGDFYWMSKAPNGKVYLAVADCTGHGVPGAILSVIGTALLDEIIVQQNTDNPAEVLNKMRWEVIRLLNPEGAEEETNDGIDMVLCSFNFEEKNISGKIKLEFACAKNPLIHLRNKSITEYLPDYFCVGKDENYEKPFTSKMIELIPGDKIYIYSDGYADQFGGEKGKKFKVKNLQELLLQTSHLSMNEQLVYLQESHESWKGSYAQVDDMCVIGISF